MTDKVLLISPTGDNLGLKTLKEAQEMADIESLQLIAVSSDTNPPVYRLFNITNSKRRVRPKQKKDILKTVKISTKISDNDLETKINTVQKFLDKKYRVRIVVQPWNIRGNKKMDTANIFADELLKNFSNSATISQRYFSSYRDLTLLLIPNK